MTPNPLNDIEDKKTWTDFGKQAFLIYKGAMEEGANEFEALAMVSAFYAGMFKGAKSEGEDSSGNSES